MAISKTWLQELQVSIKKTVKEVTLKGEKNEGGGCINEYR